MGINYQASLTIRCWKEHRCVGCGSTYAYPLLRRATVTAATAEELEARAQASALRSVHAAIKYVPCPSCGTYQPDMIGARRMRRHLILFWAALGAFVILVCLTLLDVFTLPVASFVATGLCALAAFGNLLIDRHNPNANREGNLGRAQELLEKQQLQWGDEAPHGVQEDQAEGNETWSAWQRLAYLLLFLSAALPPMCEMHRSTSGWPLNDDWHPPVVGPGDETYVYLPDYIECVANNWRGKAEVIAVREDQPHLPPLSLQATGKDRDTEDLLDPDGQGGPAPTRLWVRVKIPRSKELAGETLHLRIQLTITSRRIGTNVFTDEEKTFRHQATLELAESRAGRRYEKLWWVGMASGGGATLLLTLCLLAPAYACRRWAPPAAVYAEGAMDGNG